MHSTTEKKKSSMSINYCDRTGLSRVNVNLHTTEKHKFSFTKVYLSTPNFLSVISTFWFVRDRGSLVFDDHELSDPSLLTSLILGPKNS